MIKRNNKDDLVSIPIKENNTYKWNNALEKLTTKIPKLIQEFDLQI